MSGVQYLSVAEAAHVLGVTPATVRLMARRDQLPVAARTKGGVHLFDPHEVQQAAERRAKRREEAVAQSRA